MLTTTEIAAHLKVGTHGSTYGGNPLACAVAEAVLDVVNTPEVLNGIKQREQLFRQGLEAINAKYHCFSEARGQGLLLGAVLNDDFKAAPATSCWPPSIRACWRWWRAPTWCASHRPW